MLRAAALAIVMTLTAGPVMGLVCKAVCSSPVAGAPTCHRTEPASTISVTAVHDCSSLAYLAPAILREDGGRGDVSHHEASAPVVPAMMGAVPAVRALAPAIGGGSHPPPRGPVTLVLRI